MRTAPSKKCKPKVVVDASGQSSMIMSRLKLREWDPVLKKAAVWTYWEGAYRDTGRDEGATVVIQTGSKQGWFWYIPLHDDILSVGVVAAYDYLFKNRDAKDHETIYQRGSRPIARRAGPHRPRPASHRVFMPPRNIRYRSRQAAGDGWVLVGDAFGFLDPLYSSGVLLALKSGQLAADAMAEGLAKRRHLRRQLGKWEPDFIRGMDRMRRLVCEYYDGFSFGRFVQKHPDFKGHLTDLLIGDLFKDSLDEVFVLIDAMKAERQPA